MGDHMDWYFGRDVDYLLQKDQEPQDSFPSRDHLLQRAATTFKNFGYPNKYCVQATKSTIKELNLNRQHLNCEANKESSVPGGESTCGLTTCWEFPLVDCGGGNPEASLQRTGHSGYQLDGLGGTYRMDDTLLSSLLDEDPPHMGNPYRPINTLPEFECSTMSFDNLSTDMIMDLNSISRESSGMGNFPQSTFWEKLECTSEHFLLSDTGQAKCSPMTKAPSLSVSIPSELNTFHKEIGHVDKETSWEAMVLQELQAVITQLTQKTRICFRDALYRLAKCSKQQHLLSQIRTGEITMETLSSCDKNMKLILRSGGIKSMELETNTIDRTVASLMFTKLNCDQLDLSFVESVNPSEEAVSSHESHSCSLKQSPIIPHQQSILSRDAEVPFFDIEQNRNQFVPY